MDTKKSIQTLCIIIKNSEVLLGKKTRKLGKGFYNAPGGKVEEGESILDSIKREVKEEARLTVKNLKQVGLINFEFQDGSQGIILHIFLTKDFEGELMDSEQMHEWKWFDFHKVPYEIMWDDDKDWLPLVLGGGEFEAKFVFDHPSTAENIGRVMTKELKQIAELKQEFGGEQKPWKIK